jgi:hypothetical protein
MSPKSSDQSNLEHIIADIGVDCDVLFGVQLLWVGAPRGGLLRGNV